MKRKPTKDVNLAKSLARAWLFISLCLCASVVNYLAQDWKPVADGVEYAQVRREFSSKPVNINLLRLDLKNVRLDVHHALDRAIGTEKTSSIATRHGAFAAINAGFFRLDTSIWAGDSVGSLMVNGNLFSESNLDRIALSIVNNKNETAIEIAPIDIQAWLAFSASRFQIRLAGVNREKKTGESIIYTRDFGGTTRTLTPSVEILFSDCRQEVKKKALAHKCKTAEIRRDVSNSTIPAAGYVLSLSSEETKSNKLFLYDLDLYISEKKKGNTFEIRLENTMENTVVRPSPEMDIVAGVPQLIKNGKIDITWEQEKASRSFVETRHPRSAVAKLKDGKFLMLTADGRSEQSSGLDLYDLAKYMLELGAVDAMNLDGGGSTTMFLDGKVVNRPSDKDGERKVGDAILVTLRKKKKT